MINTASDRCNGRLSNGAIDSARRKARRPGCARDFPTIKGCTLFDLPQKRDASICDGPLWTRPAVIGNAFGAPDRRPALSRKIRRRIGGRTAREGALNSPDTNGRSFVRAGRLHLSTLQAIWRSRPRISLAACSSAPKQAAFEPPVFPPPPAEPRFIYERTLTGSSDVVAETREDKFRRFATGETQLGKRFSKPFGIVADHGRIYISDTVSRYVHMLDLKAGAYAEIGVKGMGRLTKPLGLALDHQGRLFVCDGSARRVVVFSHDGDFITAVGGEDALLRPSDVAVNEDGSKIYVVDTGGVSSTDHHVRIFDFAGKRLGDIGRRGGRDGEFNLPLAITMGPGQRLHVLDTGNFRVQTFDASGAKATIENKFGQPGRFPGQFSHGKGIATDTGGRIYVSDTGFGVVQIFTPDGRILMSIGNRNESPGPGQFILPAGVAVDVDGRVYVVDQFYAKVDVFRPAYLPPDWPFGVAYQPPPGTGLADEEKTDQPK